MREFATAFDVVFWEEPVYEPVADASLRVHHDESGDITVVTPVLPESGSAGLDIERQRALLNTFAGDRQEWIRWYYTPMMLPFSRDLQCVYTVYDCMDELANFRNAPAEMAWLENELLNVADVVFTGGQSLFEAKRGRHKNIHAFPSSIDRLHFSTPSGRDPSDQADLPRPRFGYYGVIDERIDLQLLADLAQAQPDWSIVMLGPVVKISPDDLPRQKNIRYLGMKAYEELPHYLQHWDVALMPFAINDATRFISPTKTPEYLSGGRPVVSTPIADVVRQYGHLDAVAVADGSMAFIDACKVQLALSETQEWRTPVDNVLKDQSWRQTALKMRAIIFDEIRRNARMTCAPVRKAAPTKGYGFLIVGAGFAGSVMAERLATQSGARVLVIDQRTHIAGNAYDCFDEAGILMHRYGPHIFHTNSQDVFDYLSQFTSWRPYEHRVLASVDGIMAPIPINRTTLNMLYDAGLTTDAEAIAFLAARAERRISVRTSEDVVVSAVGRDLYEKFFRGYTRKQWGLDPSALDKSVTARVPTRTNTDDRYFTDRFQAMPDDGYTAMFENMLDHPKIDVALGESFEGMQGRLRYDALIYTGPIDAYFKHAAGRLPYRSLQFEHKNLPIQRFQEVGTVNYPEESVPYTRITEYKHLTGQQSPTTTITYEHPCADGDPFYPIPRPENQALYKEYEAAALKERGVHFVGRLANYRYYNMDQVVGQALALFRRLDSAKARGGAIQPATASKQLAGLSG